MSSNLPIIQFTYVCSDVSTETFDFVGLCESKNDKIRSMIQALGCGILEELYQVTLATKL